MQKGETNNVLGLATFKPSYLSVQGYFAIPSRGFLFETIGGYLCFMQNCGGTNIW